MKGCKHNEDYIMSLDEDGETNICAACLINDVRNETLDKAIAEIDKKLKTCIIYDVTHDPKVKEMFDDMYAFKQKQLNELKSALIDMKNQGDENRSGGKA